MSLRILHTNDFHGKLTPELAVRISEQKRGGLYLDSGDCIKAGNLAIPIAPDSAWPLLKQAGCDASVIGNRETHVLESAFRKKLEGAAHPVLCANLRRRDGSASPLKSHIVLEQNGLKIGVFGVSVAMVTEKMATQSLSAYLWDAPIETASSMAQEIRDSVDVLIALTHIGIAQDRKLAEACPEIDLILGGHSHTVLEHPEQVNGVWIAQGGSHARFIGVYEFEPAQRFLSGGLLPAAT